MKKRFYCIMLSVLMVLSALLPAFRVSAEERGKNISPDVNITKFTIENWEGKEVDIPNGADLKLNWIGMLKSMEIL